MKRPAAPGGAWLPVDFLARRMLTQPTDTDVVHPHPFGAATEMVPMPPIAGNACVVLETE